MPQAVYGVQFGYKGFFELPLRELTLETVAYIHKVLSLLALLVQKSTSTDTCLPLRELELTHERTREPVAYIHKRGGTILGSSREFEAFSY